MDADRLPKPYRGRGQLEAFAAEWLGRPAQAVLGVGAHSLGALWSGGPPEFLWAGGLQEGARRADWTRWVVDPLRDVVGSQVELHTRGLVRIAEAAYLSWVDSALLTTQRGDLEAIVARQRLDRAQLERARDKWATWGDDARSDEMDAEQARIESARFAMPESLRGVDAHLLYVLGVELVRSQRRLTPKSLFARARSSRDDGCVAAQIAARDACHYVFQLHYRRHLEGRKRWPSKNQRRDYWASSMELASKLLFAVWPPQTGADNGEDVAERLLRQGARRAWRPAQTKEDPETRRSRCDGVWCGTVSRFLVPSMEPAPAPLSAEERRSLKRRPAEPTQPNEFCFWSGCPQCVAAAKGGGPRPSNA